jgi:hypothetical protein
MSFFHYSSSKLGPPVCIEIQFSLGMTPRYLVGVMEEEAGLS